MKILLIVMAAIVLALASGWFFVKRKLRGMAGGVKIIIIMQRLHQFSADLKRQGTFTNDIPHLCEISIFQETYTVNASRYQCVLAAKSPLFCDEGCMAITSEDIIIWIDPAGKATPFNGPDAAASVKQ